MCQYCDWAKEIKANSKEFRDFAYDINELIIKFHESRPDAIINKTAFFTFFAVHACTTMTFRETMDLTNAYHNASIVLWEVLLKCSDNITLKEIRDNLFRMNLDDESLKH